MALSQSVTPAPDIRFEQRQARLDARYAQWALSSLKRTKHCGKTTTNVSDGVTVMASGTASDGSRRAGLSGVQSCGSVWACPVCAAKIQARRQVEIASALAVARLRNWEVLFLTLTMRHDSGHRLNRLWNHLSKAWGAVTTGGGQRQWKRDKADYGIAGYVRLVEVTHGERSGWHVHAHVLLFCDPHRAELLRDPSRTSMGFPQGIGVGGGFTDEEVQGLGIRMFLRWRGALNVKGIRPTLRRGVDIRRVRGDENISDYFAKQLYHLKGETSTSFDATGSTGKQAKNGNRTPFGILADLVQIDTTTGECGPNTARDLDLWEIFEQASKGRRQLLWARGFRKDVLGETDVADDIQDEDIVEQSPGGDPVLTIPTELWRQIARRRLIGDVLELAEADDTGSALARWLADRLAFYHPTRPI